LLTSLLLLLLLLLLMQPSLSRQDGNGTNWTPSELSAVLAIWRSVAEDFAAYDLDVTTEEPVGLPVNHWVRAAIGGAYTDCECGALPAVQCVCGAFDIQCQSLPCWVLCRQILHVCGWGLASAGDVEHELATVPSAKVQCEVQIVCDWLLCSRLTSSCACRDVLQGIKGLLVVSRMLASLAGPTQQHTNQPSASARTWAQTT
jgi:hypothetical protein